MRSALVAFRSSSLSLVAFAALTYAPAAFAQDTRPAATAVVVAVPGETGSDHDSVVGHFAVGYFGISNLPVGAAGTGGASPVSAGSISAPVIGARYWFSQKLGLDAGVGFSDSSAGWGVAVHAGLPIALATSRHMTFELIPEATVAFAGNTAGTGAGEITYSGFKINLGARIGGEIQFGFIGIPQLALQATVGAYLDHDSASFSTNTNSGSVTSTILTTSVQNNPWGIFTDNVSALYYF